jgi:hypothetical protein
MVEVKVPQNLSLNNSVNFCNSLWKLEDSKDYIFNFINLADVQPFTMAYVSNEIKRFRQSKPESRFRAINHEKKTYTAHMGFFSAFGLNFGNKPGEAKGSNTYLPLTILNVSELEKEAIISFCHIGDILEEKSKLIARLLTRQDSGDLVDTLTFSIREIMRNVVEHSNSEIIEYCAQYWPTKNLVEVAILDTGDGIKKGLSSNPYLNLTSERDAIHYALLPGISGKMYKGIIKRKNDNWQNSGFGLYMTSRICRNGGSFFLVSNDKGIFLEDKSKKDFDCNYQGTALRLRINTKKIDSYSKMLEKYKNEGDAAAKNFAGDAAIEPSVASTMLARDFQ